MSDPETENERREALLELSEALDPAHQGDGWPDPVEWDGRPLAEQARDLLALADAAAGLDLDERPAAEDRIARAAARVRLVYDLPRGVRS